MRNLCFLPTNSSTTMLNYIIVFLVTEKYMIVNPITREEDTPVLSGQ
jgi:hypothetical protein